MVRLRALWCCRASSQNDGKPSGSVSSTALISMLTASIMRLDLHRDPGNPAGLILDALGMEAELRQPGMGTGERVAMCEVVREKHGYLLLGEMRLQSDLPG